MAYASKDTETNYTALVNEFVTQVKSDFNDTSSDISERNASITDRDQYIYSDLLERSINIPIGHDFTPVNWLRRTVEIHKNMFMSRGFQMVSSYDTDDTDNAADEQDRQRKTIENRKRQEYAELRQNLIDSIIKDNGGFSTWGNLAENCSAVGSACVKCYYDEDEKKYVISPIESIENVYVLWDKDDFRKPDAVAYVYQVSKSNAIKYYGAPKDVQTSPLGQPLQVVSANTYTTNINSQQMVTIMEVTGYIEGWTSEKGRIKKVPVGKEEEFNCTIVGNNVTKIIDDENKIPKYYIFPNKRQRRRAWGTSDISDAAININATYIETLSDWRTVSAKVNFPKYKGYGFGFDTQMPKSEPRKIQVIPLADGQDLQQLDQGDSANLDFRTQLDELKEQFVRETGISRVLFDDPSVTFNSNQALLTSMKPTSDIAEAKKQLWTPILNDLFTDALETLAKVDPDTYGDLVSTDDNWSLKVMWPSIMQKEDPIFQNMLINRFNAGTMSLQSYLEQQGETKEEIDRLKEEMGDPVTAAVLGKQLPAYAQAIINYATAEMQAAYQATLPQKTEQNANTPGVDSNGGTAATQIQASQAENVPGAGLIPQPGTGAVTSNEGAVAQVAQNAGA